MNIGNSGLLSSREDADTSEVGNSTKKIDQAASQQKGDQEEEEERDNVQELGVGSN